MLLLALHLGPRRQRRCNPVNAANVNSRKPLLALRLMTCRQNCLLPLIHNAKVQPPGTPYSLLPYGLLAYGLLPYGLILHSLLPCSLPPQPCCFIACRLIACRLIPCRIKPAVELQLICPTCVPTPVAPARARLSCKQQAVAPNSCLFRKARLSCKQQAKAPASCLFSRVRLSWKQQAVAPASCLFSRARLS
jgi:hypothetical protein